jgi:NADPH-dependent 2,4-dienoyl-CoA reductase/sulfur reductase-like enzyme
MNRPLDLLVVGAGPAGMSAAILARQFGLKVLVVDEQDAPGGQIWRNIESVAGTPRMAILGKAYEEGLAVVRRFRTSGATYEPSTQVWQLEAGPRAFTTRDGAAASIEAGCLLLATGAQERPTPFPGWTLPGVMTVGAAQIVLKSSDQIPAEPVWIAGSGPLALLYAVQLLKTGGQIAGFLDTSRRGQMVTAFPKSISALLSAPRDLLKGLGWLLSLKKRVPFVRNVVEIEAIGTETLQAIRYVTAQGRSETVEASLLLVHEGVVPTIHPTLALGCRHIWNSTQDSFAPELDAWGETSEAGVFVAGDGAGIGGAAAAGLRGELAALRIVVRCGHLTEEEAAVRARPIRARLRRTLGVRPFLDSLYRPRPSVFVPPDHTIACRCEEVSVASIRDQIANGRPGPNQIKAFTRAGMGPCQGRQCGYTIAQVLASAQERPVPDVGLYRVRPPIKPVTLSELASLDCQDSTS